MANKFNPDWDEIAACKECLQEYMEEIKKLKKEWVGLTDEEVEQILFGLRVETMGVITTEGMVRALEAKLKEKNHG